MSRPKRIDHVAIIVRNIEQALLFYRDTLGITPSEIKEVPTEQVRIAFLPMGGPGGSEIELIEPTNPDSSLAKFLEKRGEGLHHICLEVEDIDLALTEMQQKGAWSLWKGDVPDNRLEQTTPDLRIIQRGQITRRWARDIGTSTVTLRFAQGLSQGADRCLAAMILRFAQDDRALTHTKLWIHLFICIIGALHLLTMEYSHASSADSYPAYSSAFPMP